MAVDFECKNNVYPWALSNLREPPTGAMEKEWVATNVQPSVQKHGTPEE